MLVGILFPDTLVLARKDSQILRQKLPLKHLTDLGGDIDEDLANWDDDDESDSGDEVCLSEEEEDDEGSGEEDEE